MRIHDGNYAYDIEPFRDPLTQLLSKWVFRIFRLRPEPEQVILRGEAENRVAVERKAKAALARLIAKEKVAA